MEGKKYSLDDIETLRDKTGLSYEESVGLLEKYDGDIARALIEMEKRGCVNKEKSFFASLKLDGTAGEFLKKWWLRGYHTRVIVERGERRLIDLSVLFLLLALLTGWRLLLCAVVLALILGCHVRIESEQEDAQSETVPEAEAPAEDAESDSENAESGYSSITIE